MCDYSYLLLCFIFIEYFPRINHWGLVKTPVSASLTTSHHHNHIYSLWKMWISELVKNSEGVTCSTCSRLSTIPRHITSTFEQCYNITPQHDYASEVFSEIDCQAGIPSSLQARANHLFLKAKFASKTYYYYNGNITRIFQKKNIYFIFPFERILRNPSIR